MDLDFVHIFLKTVDGSCNLVHGVNLITTGGKGVSDLADVTFNMKLNLSQVLGRVMAFTLTI